MPVAVSKQMWMSSLSGCGGRRWRRQGRRGVAVSDAQRDAGRGSRLAGGLCTLSRCSTSSMAPGRGWGGPWRESKLSPKVPLPLPAPTTTDHGLRIGGFVRRPFPVLLQGMHAVRGHHLPAERCVESSAPPPALSTPFDTANQRAPRVHVLQQVRRGGCVGSLAPAGGCGAARDGTIDRPVGP